MKAQIQIFTGPQFLCLLDASLGSWPLGGRGCLQALILIFVDAFRFESLFLSHYQLLLCVCVCVEGKGREGKGREGKGREGKGREGKGEKETDVAMQS